MFYVCNKIKLVRCWIWMEYIKKDNCPINVNWGLFLSSWWEQIKTHAYYQQKNTIAHIFLKRHFHTLFCGINGKRLCGYSSDASSVLSIVSLFLISTVFYCSIPWTNSIKSRFSHCSECCLLTEFQLPDFTSIDLKIMLSQQVDKKWLKETHN